jgi:hypothetical protein
LLAQTEPMPSTAMVIVVVLSGSPGRRVPQAGYLR